MFYVGRARSRFDTTLRFNIEDEHFMAYVTSTSDGQETDYTGREFFGIADSRVSDKIAEKYRKLYILASKKELLFPHVLFGDQRYVAPNYVPLAEDVQQRHGTSSIQEFLVVGPRCGSPHQQGPSN
ncbi:hypothetical protein AAVH_35035, partial [Aphelenchoides avenae]